MGDMIPFRFGDDHPTGRTRVRVALSQKGLFNEGEAGDFNWSISPKDDMGARIVAYKVVKEG